MRVLITGATGFLGGHLCNYLRARGFEVLATGRSQLRCDALRVQGLHVIKADLKGPLKACSFPKFDAVVHAAALSAPAGPAAVFDEANVTTTRNVVALAQKTGTRRFVNISSPSVAFALRDQICLREDAPLPRPFNHYARTKAEAEQLVLASNDIGALSLRPRGIYGPGDKHLLPRLLEAARRMPLPLFRGGRGAIDLTHVDDVCCAIEAALLAGPEVEGEVFNISGGEVLPTREIIDRTCERAEITPRWRKMPLQPMLMLARGFEGAHQLMRRPGEPRVSAYGLALLAFEQSLDLRKAARMLNWQPMVKFTEGLESVFSGRGPDATDLRQ